MTLPLWAVPGSKVICIRRTAWRDIGPLLIDFISGDRHPHFREECEVSSIIYFAGYPFLKLRGFNSRHCYRVDQFRPKHYLSDDIDVEARIFRARAKSMRKTVSTDA